MARPVARHARGGLMGEYGDGWPVRPVARPVVRKSHWRV